MIDQAMLDSMAQECLTHLGGLTELVTVTQRANPSATPTTYAGVTAFVEDLKETWQQAMGLIPQDRVMVLRGDKQVRIATRAVTWVPTTYDEVTRADSTVWRVQAVGMGGPGDPWVRLHVRRHPS